MTEEDKPKGIAVEVIQKSDDCLYEKQLLNYPGSKLESSQAEKQLKYFVQDEKKRFDVNATANRFKYLFELTHLFKHFLTSKAEKDPKFKQVLDTLKKQKELDTIKEQEHRRRRTEKEEDAELLKEEEDEEDGQDGETTVGGGYEFTESPKFVDGQLRPYQVQGLNWLVSLNTNDLSGILADEMGLGKTLQTISFLGYLRYIKKNSGPHLIIVPKSTLENWQREFAKWTPEVSTVVLTGDQQTRNEIIKERIMKCDYDVIISSYEIVIREKSILKKINWQYIIVDEAHRLKNEDSLLSQIIRMFHSQNRLLITGTPLQNNLHELWALLNFLLPDIFADSVTFDEWFSSTDENQDNEEGQEIEEINKEDERKQELIVQQLHKVLQPFLLRRIKSDVEKSLLPKQELNVYVGMTDMQRNWYQKILEKDIDAVNGAQGKKESKTRLLNIVMQLRKCCNHPYLFEGAEPGPPYTTDEHLIYNSQKMLVLDKLLRKLEEQGSRVLIFSQMSRMLDILEDYCVFREFGYCRIDGQTDHTDRIKAIDDYNRPGSDKFVFLLTTRAGGLGINLTSADVVVLYDSDWNPQADLQAMDRAHRIGQTKQVKVFRFVTENAIEEKVLERASQKLRLDQLVIQQGRVGIQKQEKNKGNSKDELLNMIQHGAADVLAQSGSIDNIDGENNGKNLKRELTDDDIEKILMLSEKKTGALKSKYSKLGLDDLQNFASSESVYEWDGKNFQKKDISKSKLGNTGFSWISLAKRERKNNYSIDGYYREVLHTGGRPPSTSANNNNGPRAPKHLNLYDHQFYTDHLYDLHDLEWHYYKKITKQAAELPKGSKDTLKQREVEQDLEQELIDHSRGLTEEEEELKNKLLNEGFYNWSRRDFFAFISANAKFGRQNIRDISNEIEDKVYEEVKEYAEVFWLNYRNIENYERYITQIEQGEEKLKKMKIQKEMLRRKMSQYDYPLRDLTLKLPHAATTKKTFSEDEDRFLMVQMYRIGLDSTDLYDVIKHSIKESKMFAFDYFFQSRNSAEINRRCATLLQALSKEFDAINKKRKAMTNKGKKRGTKRRKA